ncbi:ATP-grasp domain-containing protein [Streptomyces wedmorensis]|uniref:ATP-grasp domain-containing protein n=1 Tax=Streptomyces wedmorensis TaxID=43759 RepID=UPI0034465E89
MSGPSGTARPHLVVLHRWRARYAHYERYVDHDAHAVTYVTTEVGAAAVPDGAAEVVRVPATDDLARVRKEVDGLAARHGAPRAVVALKEDDLLVAANLAREWGCATRHPDELLRFRDKYVMADAVARAGLAVPATARATGPEDVRVFAAAHGLPVVLKPAAGSSSEGVLLVADERVLAGMPFVAGQDLIVQAHVPHPVFHVDGVFDGGKALCLKVSRYLNTCLGFREGTALGSVEEDRTHVTEAVHAFAERALRALTCAPTPFHLEVFVDADAHGGPAVTFLEVGARVGGAEIPYVWREVHGYDLMEAAFRIALGQPPQKWESPPGPQESAGWLLVPAPAARPCVITDVTPMTGRSPGPYAEELLRPGEVLPDAAAYYEHVGGRFRFRGPDSATVAAAVEATARDFRVTGESCGGDR